MKKAKILWLTGIAVVSTATLIGTTLQIATTSQMNKEIKEAKNSQRVNLFYTKVLQAQMEVYNLSNSETYKDNEEVKELVSLMNQESFKNNKNIFYNKYLAFKKSLETKKVEMVNDNGDKDNEKANA